MHPTHVTRCFWCCTSRVPPHKPRKKCPDIFELENVAFPRGPCTPPKHCPPKARRCFGQVVYDMPAPCSQAKYKFNDEVLPSYQQQFNSIACWWRYARIWRIPFGAVTKASSSGASRMLYFHLVTRNVCGLLPNITQIPWSCTECWEKFAADLNIDNNNQ